MPCRWAWDGANGGKTGRPPWRMNGLDDIAPGLDAQARDYVAKGLMDNMRAEAAAFYDQAERAYENRQA